MSTTTARVTLTIDITVRGAWGDACTVAQVRKQAAEEALNHVNRLVNDGELRAAIIGKPKVTAIMHGED